MQDHAGRTDLHGNAQHELTGPNSKGPESGAFLRDARGRRCSDRSAIGLRIRDVEGQPHDHKLTEYDARLYAGKYNRVLLRRAVRDVQSNQKSISWRSVPSIGGGPLAGGGGALTLTFMF